MQKTRYTIWKKAAEFSYSSPFGGGLRLSSPSSSLSSTIHSAGTRRPPAFEPEAEAWSSRPAVLTK